MRVVDPGHRYDLLSLDGDHEQTLQFVKRVGTKFPGNQGEHPGTTLQSVLRALVDRVEYLQGQVWCPENAAILFFLRLSIWLLEFRAARRHGKTYWKPLHFAETSKMCWKCGHTLCDCPKWEPKPLPPMSLGWTERSQLKLKVFQTRDGKLHSVIEEEKKIKNIIPTCADLLISTSKD